MATVSVGGAQPAHTFAPPAGGPPAAPPPAAAAARLLPAPLLLGGLAALILVLAAVLVALIVHSQAGSSNEPAATSPPTAAPQLHPSALVLMLSDLPGYSVRPASSPASGSDSTAEAQFQSSGPPARIVISLADVTYNDQTAAEEYQSTRNTHLAGGLREAPAPALGQAASLFTNGQTSVLLWREGPVVCQISASATVANQELTALGQRQDERVRAALKGG
jgi:hypothetical protein